ncbi:MAG TPA: hypothetical protein VHC70_05255 [Phycisphaerales bacterium]|jgi:hypothetical protein|nr:hypothetical protein [Phycisphaerales bacterium]
MARQSSLSRVSVSDLRRELSRRQRQGGSLLRARERLALRLRELDDRLAALGLSAGGAVPGRKRFRNESSLADTLAAVLDGKTLSVGQAMDAVQKAGYKTTARNFRVMVNLTLTKDRRFKRVRRGQYTLR